MMLETVMRSIRTRTGGCIYKRMTQHLAFADDVVITGRTVNALLGAFQESEEAARKAGLFINRDITKYMVTTKEKTESMYIEGAGYRFEREPKFKYLGTVITEDNRILEHGYQLETSATGQ